MSYDLHITRAEHWTDSLDQPITGNFFIWTADDIEVPFNYSKGWLTVSRADDDVVIDKMKEIAAELNAIVPRRSHHRLFHPRGSRALVGQRHRANAS